MQDSLRPGFISFDDALKLIETDSKEHPTVKLGFLVQNADYIQKKHSLTIPLAQRNQATGRIDYTGYVWVELKTDYEVVALKHAIEGAYKRSMGREINLDTAGLRQITTEYEEGAGTSIRANAHSDTKPGDIMKSGEKIVEGETNE